MAKIKSFLVGFCFSLFILLTTIDLVAFNPYFFKKSYQQEKTSEIVKMSDNDLWQATNTLLTYLKGQREDIIVKARINGNERNVFNEREIAHMVDVKRLYQKAMMVRMFSLLLLTIILLYELFQDQKHFLTFLYTAFKQGLAGFGLLILIISIYALTGFETFWLNFHYLFFDNDLFLLDPNTSIMINMFPENFFFNLVMYIIVIFVLFNLIIYIIFDFLKKRRLV